jgi:hypothetical protein
MADDDSPLKRQDEWARWNYGHGITFALEGLKTALLLNGGAAIALLAFAGSYAAVKDPSLKVNLLVLKGAFPRFATGALVAAVAFALAYLAQFFFGLRVERQIQLRRPLHYLPETFQVVGVALFVLSLAKFSSGVFRAASAFRP